LILPQRYRTITGVRSTCWMIGIRLRNCFDSMRNREEPDSPKRLQTETTAELDALLSAILPPSLGFGRTGDRAFKGER
jgi:hypothetical protein